MIFFFQSVWFPTHFAFSLSNPISLSVCLFMCISLTVVIFIPNTNIITSYQITAHTKIKETYRTCAQSNSHYYTKQEQKKNEAVLNVHTTKKWAKSTTTNAKINGEKESQTRGVKHIEFFFSLSESSQIECIIWNTKTFYWRNSDGKIVYPSNPAESSKIAQFVRSS